jgi:hypothetical protein
VLVVRLILMIKSRIVYKGTLKKSLTQFMKHIKQHFSNIIRQFSMRGYPKTHKMAGYSPYFLVKNALFFALPKSHWGFWRLS